MKQALSTGEMDEELLKCKHLAQSCKKIRLTLSSFALPGWFNDQRVIIWCRIAAQGELKINVPDVTNGGRISQEAEGEYRGNKLTLILFLSLTAEGFISKSWHVHICSGTILRMLVAFIVDSVTDKITCRRIKTVSFVHKQKGHIRVSTARSQH